MDANTFLYAPTRSITFMKAIILAAYFATLQKLHSVKILTNYQNIEPIRLQNIASNLMFEKSVLSYKENDK